VDVGEGEEAVDVGEVDVFAAGAVGGDDGGEGALKVFTRSLAEKIGGRRAVKVVGIVDRRPPISPPTTE